LRRRWLGLGRTRPFSRNYGWDRGTPVDRFYVTAFLNEFAGDIRGSVLEVKAPDYAERFGGTRVLEQHVLDIDPRNPRATIIADLAEPDTLPADRFDCFILTQTLQYVRDLDTAMRNAWRSLRRGGVLLVTAPTINRIDIGKLAAVDAWRLTPVGLRLLVERCCPGAHAEVCGYGNAMAGAAFLYGLAVEELSLSRLCQTDENHPVVACARIQRPAA
jgi:SAM-dependent methyltransferase